MNLTEDQILMLAPDEASKKTGKDLANQAKWLSKAINEKALWGECQGSGSKPYQTQVDIKDLAFKCSCPSRKFPCKHGLGLLILHARQPLLFTSANMPAWVNDWLEKRETREEKKEEKTNKPIDEAAQVKRQESRQKKVLDGMEELLLWIKDIVRNGILNMPNKPASYFENMAKRLVDAQASGLAGIVRGLGSTSFFKEGWQSDFTDQLLQLYMVMEGYKNHSQLSELLQKDFKSLVGFSQNQDELKEQQGINDVWLVLGKQVTEDDNLTTERFWLYGLNSKKYALILNFLIQGQGSNLVLTPGLQLQAELVFYPSIAPLRAIIKRQLATDNLNLFIGFNNWQSVAEQETAINELLPITTERPFIIKNIKPIFYQQQWWLQDVEQRLVAIKDEFSNIWKLLSISGGEALDMAMVGKENKYLPLGVWKDGKYKII